MASLNRAFDGILRNWGHNILLQRRTPDGKGFVQRLERHTVRHAVPSQGLARVEEERREGVVRNSDALYYFRAEAKPREGDRIYERDDRFDGRDDRVGTLDGYAQTTWTIDSAIPVRGKGGRIVYWAAGASRETPN